MPDALPTPVLLATPHGATIAEDADSPKYVFGEKNTMVRTFHGLRTVLLANRQYRGTVDGTSTAARWTAPGS